MSKNSQSVNEPDDGQAIDPTLGRRQFLKASALAAMGGALSASAAEPPKATGADGAGLAVPGPIGVEEGYWDRTDRFEEKLRLIEAAWRKKDHRMVRALTHSLRTTAIQAQAEEESIVTNPFGPATAVEVRSLPASWREWCRGWKWCQVMALEETAGEVRRMEPVEVGLRLPVVEVGFVRRELRVVRVVEGRLEEIPSQVLDERRRGAFWECRVVFQADSAARERRIHLILYGNADAELPAYKTDLATSGEGFALDIENAWYKASLSRQMGQLERLTLKREHSLELFSGGQGHGEPPGIDWAHDYVPGGNFQKLRISLWETCPEFEVSRGPVCTTIRRWGFPHSPVHPLFSPARLNIDIEYRFYAGLPWFLKLGTMEAIREFEAQALRDDEWVFSGHSFTDKLWMGPDGVLRDGDVPPQFNEQLHAVGFYNRQSRDAFIAMFLEHRADGLPELKHTGAPTLAYKWHGQLWSRGPLPVKRVPAGAILRERNAYLATELGSLADAAPVESLRRQWLQPLKVSSAPVPESGLVTSQSSRLARPGEAGDSAIPKRLIWEALRDCKDAQLYTADASVVDLGLIYDIQVRGSAVHVVMAMPHRGRPLAGYFVHGSISVHPTKSVPIRERLLQVPGVRTVSVEQVWEPVWSSNFLTDAGRQKMGLSPAV